MLDNLFSKLGVKSPQLTVSQVSFKDAKLFLQTDYALDTDFQPQADEFKVVFEGRDVLVQSVFLQQYIHESKTSIVLSTNQVWPAKAKVTVIYAPSQEARLRTLDNQPLFIDAFKKDFSVVAHAGQSISYKSYALEDIQVEAIEAAENGSQDEPLEHLPTDTVPIEKGEIPLADDDVMILTEEDLSLDAIELADASTDAKEPQIAGMTSIDNEDDISIVQLSHQDETVQLEVVESQDLNLKTSKIDLPGVDVSAVDLESHEERVVNKRADDVSDKVAPLIDSQMDDAHAFNDEGVPNQEISMSVIDEAFEVGLELDFEIQEVEEEIEAVDLLILDESVSSVDISGPQSQSRPVSPDADELPITKEHIDKGVADEAVPQLHLQPTEAQGINESIDEIEFEPVLLAEAVVVEKTLSPNILVNTNDHSPEVEHLEIATAEAVPKEMESVAQLSEVDGKKPVLRYENQRLVISDLKDLNWRTQPDKRDIALTCDQQQVNLQSVFVTKKSLQEDAIIVLRLDKPLEASRVKVSYKGEGSLRALNGHSIDAFSVELTMENPDAASLVAMSTADKHAEQNIANAPDAMIAEPPKMNDALESFTVNDDAAQTLELVVDDVMTANAALAMPGEMNNIEALSLQDDVSQNTDHIDDSITHVHDSVEERDEYKIDNELLVEATAKTLEEKGALAGADQSSADSILLVDTLVIEDTDTPVADLQIEDALTVDGEALDAARANAEGSEMPQADSLLAAGQNISLNVDEPLAVEVSDIEWVLEPHVVENNTSSAVDVSLDEGAISQDAVLVDILTLDDDHSVADTVLQEGVDTNVDLSADISLTESDVLNIEDELSFQDGMDTVRNERESIDDLSVGDEVSLEISDRMSEDEIISGQADKKVSDVHLADTLNLANEISIVDETASDESLDLEHQTSMQEITRVDTALIDDKNPVDDDIVIIDDDYVNDRSQAVSMGQQSSIQKSDKTSDENEELFLDGSEAADTQQVPMPEQQIKEQVDTSVTGKPVTLEDLAIVSDESASKEGGNRVALSHQGVGVSADNIALADAIDAPLTTKSIDVEKVLDGADKGFPEETLNAQFDDDVPVAPKKNKAFSKIIIIIAPVIGALIGGFYFLTSKGLL